jgi:hypothetical protein
MNPALISSFITQYTKEVKSTVQPFTLFAAIQRPGLLNRLGLRPDTDNAHIFHLPVVTEVGIVDQNLLDEVSYEFWITLKDNDRAEWAKLAADIQQLF